jgi:hypothetical protein
VRVETAKPRATAFGRSRPFGTAWEDRPSRARVAVGGRERSAFAGHGGESGGWANANRGSISLHPRFTSAASRQVRLDTIPRRKQAK